MPFSIKKPSGVHGLIFGTGHPLGAEKFLEVAWKENELNGEANFDIHSDEEASRQLDLFEKRTTKIEVFEDMLETGLLDQSIKTEAGIYRFCIDSGMRPQHASSVLKKLKKEGKLECRWQTPNINSFLKGENRSFKITT